MSAMAMPLMLTNTLLQSQAAIKQGEEADKLAQYKASQLEQKAGQERAVSQRKAAGARKRARFAESRALAVAAASGGGASDPTVINIMSGIAGEGEMAAQTALYEGEERARGSEMAAEASRYEGASAKKAGKMKAFGTILSGLGKSYSLTDKYSPGDAYQPAATYYGR